MSIEKSCISYFNSPLGPILLEADDQFLYKVNFTERMGPINGKHKILKQATEQFTEYFKGTLRNFDLPLKPIGTPFQQRVWEALKTIPYGQTMSYMQLSEQLGNTKAIRAVAHSNGRNPLAIIIPCHRVIGSNGKLVGYAGGLDRKRWLLNFESVNSGLSLF
ncbi:MAG: methylated-DNA--[protein]-cysteine S-methyltransferase [Chitinophagaceae bacterium]|nr:methylated-DNA--[protein]-cysteine S-methyltransferase [Chitinophagaceae bacterium]